MTCCYLVLLCSDRSFLSIPWHMHPLLSRLSIKWKRLRTFLSAAFPSVVLTALHPAQCRFSLPLTFSQASFLTLSALLASYIQYLSLSPQLSPSFSSSSFYSSALLFILSVLSHTHSFIHPLPSPLLLKLPHPFVFCALTNLVEATDSTSSLSLLELLLLLLPPRHIHIGSFQLAFASASPPEVMPLRWMLTSHVS